MQEYEACILKTEFRGDNKYLINLSCKDIASEIAPGQFVQVRAGTGTDPFLRRTFSVCSADAERGIIQLLIDIVGHGTELLCCLKRGETMNIIGSLGAGYDIHLGGDGPCILVAGGTGAAPLLFLAETLHRSIKRPVTFMMGGHTDSAIRVIDGLISNGITVMNATDDGSSGFHGMVSALLEETLKSANPEALYTCGPHSMMKEITRIAEYASLTCQISLEERMACGIGVCLGCTVLLRDGRMVRSCIEGPVFNAFEVEW